MNDLIKGFDVDAIDEQDLGLIQQQITNRQIRGLAVRQEQTESLVRKIIEEMNINKTQTNNDIEDLKEDTGKKLGAITNISTVKENKWIYESQSDFGSSFEVPIGAGTVGKLFKAIGLAKISKSKTEPLHDKIGRYATMENINGHKTFRWHHEYCLEFFINWLKNNELFEVFYSIPNEKEMLKFIKKIYEDKLEKSTRLPDFN